MKQHKFLLEQLFKKGTTDPKTICKLTGISLATIYRNLKQFRKTKRLERKKGSGRPQVFNVQDKRRLVQLARKNELSTAADLKIEMEKRGSPAVHRTTIFRYLKRSNYFKMIPKKTFKLTDTHVKNRLSWCKEHKKTKWGSWIFTDESRFELFRHKIRRWAKVRPEIGVPKFGPSLMVWGGISYKGKTKLIMIRGTINSEKYQDIMSEAEPSIKTLFPRYFTFQQDNAPCHVSLSTTNWFKGAKWNVSKWPANSPDLNPIENVWRLMKTAVEKRNPKNLDHLEQIIQQVWDELDMKTVKSLVASMKNRVLGCIAAQGGRTKY